MNDIEERVERYLKTFHRNYFNLNLDIMSLQARPITHLAVDGKTMYYLRVWKDIENQFVLVNVRETVYKKLVALSNGQEQIGGHIEEPHLDNLQEGGGDVLDNENS